MRTYGGVIEALNVKGRVCNRKLARAISAMDFGECRRQRDDKGRASGLTVMVVDRWFPSSRWGRGRGSLHETWTWKDRMVRGDGGGHVEDRDLQVARHLKRSPGLRGNLILLDIGALAGGIAYQ